MIEIAAMAFNKIVLLFFYNIKHLKFQSSNTIDHWSNKNTHIDYWVVRMQYQKSFFYTSFNLSATCYNFSWRTDKENERISNWSKMFPKQSFWKKKFKILQKPNWAQCSKNPKKSQTKTLNSPKNAQSPNENFAAQTESQKPSLGWKAQIWQHCTLQFCLPRLTRDYL